MSTAPVDDARSYVMALATYDSTGLWPVLIPPDERFEWNGEDWVDRDGLPPALDEVDHRSAATVLREWWPQERCSLACFEPFTTGFPDLVRRSPCAGEPTGALASMGNVLAARPGTRLGLVEVSRPADIPAALGWSGAVNVTQDVAALSAVLRSWEDRFGARLVGLEFDGLVRAVDAPPTTERRAQHVAAEHIAFCLDTFRLQPGSLRDVARELVNRPWWRFWWD